MSYSATNWPPMSYPGASSETKIGGTYTPSAAVPSQLPNPSSGNVTWQAAAASPNSTAYRNAVTTQQQIASFFGIVDLRLQNQAA